MLIILSIIKRPIIFLVMYDIIRSIACESLFCCNCDTQITVYEWKCCEVHMQTCMYIIICYCHGWFSLYSHNCGHIDICDSLLQVLPRLHENLTLLHLHTQAVLTGMKETAQLLECISLEMLMIFLKCFPAFIPSQSP